MRVRRTNSFTKSINLNDPIYQISSQKQVPLLIQTSPAQTQPNQSTILPRKASITSSAKAPSQTLMKSTKGK